MSKKPNRIIVKTPYLSDTIKELPHGIINKTETGIGATTLELESKRNSIIVEPLKVTASAKAEKHNALYVGSPIGSFKKKIEKKDIKKYINNVGVEFKKIIVVADSLKKVMDVIPEAQHKDYFLMIDECDSFQLDATFRKSMETCYEIYKDHPKDKRCMISATPLSFSDPDLKDEDYTIIQREVPSTREITLIYSENLRGSLYDIIIYILQTHPEEKIVVAHNNVAELYNLANELEKRHKIPRKDISILCSKSSDKKAGVYFKELETSILPTKIVLKTSAYFTGFDIDEKYHLITLVQNNNKLNCFSELRLKQIAGRSRIGLHSENILYNFKVQIPEIIKKEDLIEAAKIEIKSLECISLNFKNSSILTGQIDEIRKLIVANTTKDNLNLVKKNSNGLYEISYLNIDAILELNRIKNEVYNEKNKLYEKLSMQGNVVNEKNIESRTKISKTENNSDNEAREERIKKNLDDWKKNKAIDLISSTTDQKEKLIYDVYLSLFEYIDNDFLKEKMIEFSSKRTNILLKQFKSKATLTISDETSNYKQALMSQFTVGSYYSNDEIHDKINKVLMKMGTGITVDSKKSINLFNQFVGSTRQGKKHGYKKLVKNFNPEGIIITKYSKEFISYEDLFKDIMSFN
ncbi:MAG: hypothetical protein KBC58_00395 [Flavobacterium sp.]|nr:hypothetical protein [Flavobacterium sp.]